MSWNRVRDLTKVAVIVTPGSRVGLSADLDAYQGDRLELHPEGAKGLIERGLVRLDEQEKPTPELK